MHQAPVFQWQDMKLDLECQHWDVRGNDQQQRHAVLRYRSQQEVSYAAWMNKSWQVMILSVDAGGGLEVSLALGAQIRDREGEHARALLAAKTKAKQAAEEMAKLRESHAAAVESLHAAHSAALQQQKEALEQALTVCSGLTPCMQYPHKAL